MDKDARIAELERENAELRERIASPGEAGARSDANALRSEIGERRRSKPQLALITQDDRKRALAAGFDEHLAKPVEPDELEGLLRHAAGRAGEAARPGQRG